jgi:uncharacterized protein
MLRVVRLTRFYSQPEPDMTMTPYFLIFLAGLAGSFHCIGMCGGFACAMGTDSRGRGASLLRHFIYNTGRVTSYCFLGAVAGHLGVLLAGQPAEGSAITLMQRSLAVISGALMVFIGLQFLGCFRHVRQTDRGGQYLARALGSLLRSPGAAAPLAFGVFNGFLPCPLVYAFAAQAATSGGPLPGILTMAAFGLGTFPAMFLMGGIGALWRPGLRNPGVHTLEASLLKGVGTAVAVRSDWRRQGVRVAGGFIVLLGVITFARGALPLALHVHTL